MVFILKRGNIVTKIAEMKKYLVEKKAEVSKPQTRMRPRNECH